MPTSRATPVTCSAKTRSVSVIELIVSASVATSPLASTVTFCVRSPCATAVVTAAIWRTWSVRLEAMKFTFSVRSRQVPLTPLTSAWPPSWPSVPTSRATRVTSSANDDSWSTIVLIVLFSSRISPRASTVIFWVRSPLATAVVTAAIWRTWSVRLEAIELTFSVRSRQVPLTPLTCAWPPSLPSVPTSRATRVTSSANEPSWSTISLTVLPIAENSPLTGWPSIVSAIFCERSPLATAAMTREISVVGRTRSSIIALTDSTVSFHVPSTVPSETRSVMRPSRPMIRLTRASSLAWRALSAISSLQRCWMSPITSRRRARRRTLKSPSRAAVRTRSSSSSAGSSRGSSGSAPTAAGCRRPCAQRSLRQLPCCVTPTSSLVPNRSPVPEDGCGTNLAAGRVWRGRCAGQWPRMCRCSPTRLAPPPRARPPPAVRALDRGRAPSPPARHRAGAGCSARLHFAAIVYAPVAIALTTLRKRAGLPPWLALTIASGAPLAVAAALPPRSRLRYAAAGMTYMWLFKISWELPADDEGTHRRRLRIDYPIRFDSALGGGVPPGLRLQRALRDGGRVVARSTWPSASSTARGFCRTCCSATRCCAIREYLPRAAGRLAASYHLTTPFYWFVPTAPPWWASEVGGPDGRRGAARRAPRRLQDPRPPAARRGRGGAGQSVGLDALRPHLLGGDHGDGAVGDQPAHGAIGWVYVGGAAFAVVYLGEHYLIDVLAGLAVAEVVRRAEPLAAPVVRAVAYALE